MSQAMNPLPPALCPPGYNEVDWAEERNRIIQGLGRQVDQQDDSYTYLEFREQRAIGFPFECLVAGAAFAWFVYRNVCGQDGTSMYNYDPDIRWAMPSEALLDQIFTYMRKHDIPARNPKSLVLYIKLLHAGVRIIPEAQP